MTFTLKILDTTCSFRLHYAFFIFQVYRTIILEAMVFILSASLSKELMLSPDYVQTVLMHNL
jgi:hypothetical protein